MFFDPVAVSTEQLEPVGLKANNPKLLALTFSAKLSGPPALDVVELESTVVCEATL
jgi:hypothetical protein